MRIAMVFDSMLYGGIERVGISYVKIMQELGHEVDVYILDPNVEEIVDELKNICTVDIINFSRFYCPEFYWKVAKRWNWGKYIFPWCYLVLMLVMPIMKIVKGKSKKYDISIAFSGHINDLTYVANNFVKAPKHIAWLHGALYGYYLISPGFEFLYRKIHNLVSLSSMGDIDCKTIEKYDEKNIVKIYNPIFTKRNKLNEGKVNYLREKYGEFLLMVGRISKDKDHETVVKCMKCLTEAYGRSNKIVFVGDGILKDDIANLVRRNKLEDIVIFEGTCSDVENYYSAAKIFVHSSPLEGLPTVLLEAMVFGVPIVATDSMPGVREILGNNKYGLICEVGDYNAMAHQINLLLTDEKLYSRYANLGKKRIKDFDPAIISRQLEKYLQSVYEQ